MRRIPIEDERCVAEAARALRSGAVAILPTDTLYGLSAVISNDTALARIRAIKGHDAPRRFVYVADSLDRVRSYVRSWGCVPEASLAAAWPAPLTGVFPAGTRCPGWTGATIAFRVPRFPFLQRLVEHVGEPLLSTSVNTAGAAPMTDPDVMETVYASTVDLMVVGGVEPGAQPSTVVDFTGDAPRVVRAGAYAWATFGNPSK
jgi:L-threonylcarbamoyladenylate synthase